MNRDKIFQLRVSVEDLQLVETYRARRGLRSHSEAFREALKNDAARLGIAGAKQAPPGKPKKA